MWRFDEPGFTSISSPVAVGDVLVAGADRNGDDEVIVLDATDGDIVWRRSVGPFGLGSFAVSGGEMYLKGQTGRLTSLSVATGDVAWESRVTVDGGGSTELVFTDGERVYVSAGLVAAVDASSGRELWRYGGIGGTAGILGVVGGAVFLIEAEGAEGRWVVALDAETGGERWRFTLPEGALLFGGTADEMTVIAQYHVGAGTKRMFALDAATGTPLWDVDLAGALVSWEVLHQGTAFVCVAYAPAQAMQEHVIAFDRANGSVLWRVDVGCSGLTVAGDALHFASGGKDGHLLTALERVMDLAQRG